MFSFCRNLLIGCLIVMGAIFVYGFIAGKDDRLKITTREEQLKFVVTVTLLDVTPEYAWVGVNICTAERGEDNPQPYCTYFWESESTHPTRADQVQYPIPFRGVPGGLLLITAVAWDRDKKVKARGSVTVQRGF
jgi:hypothetical protein